MVHAAVFLNDQSTKSSIKQQFGYTFNYNTLHSINALLICVTKTNLLNTSETLNFVLLVEIKIGTIWFITHTTH